MDLLVFILIAFGLTQILAFGHVFNKIRPKHKFFSCAMCIGFWVGIFLFLLNQYTELYTFNMTILNGFLLACLSSGTSYVLCQLFGDDGIKIKLK